MRMSKLYLVNVGQYYYIKLQSEGTKLAYIMFFSEKEFINDQLKVI